MELEFDFVGRAAEQLPEDFDFEEYNDTGATPAPGDLIALTLKPSRPQSGEGTRIVFRCVERLWDLSQRGAPELRVRVDLA